MSVPMNLALSLRYGENPHQKAAFYTDASVQEFNKVSEDLEKGSILCTRRITEALYVHVGWSSRC